MTGCRHGAKNTLETNYLYLAEQAGARIMANTTAVAVRLGQGGGYDVDIRRTPRGPASLVNDRRRPDRARWTFSTRQVVFAAGTLGTQALLHRLRDDRVLPGISRRLGELTRTNSEALLGATAPHVDADYTRGPAITSSIHPDEHTHIEPVRYGKAATPWACSAPSWSTATAAYPARFVSSASPRGIRSLFYARSRSAAGQNGR